jgi:uncharacterized pyridoxamine 5'-phosphate oxidase family protein
MEDGAPRVRAIGINRADEDGILIQTWKSKDVGKQLEKNPEVEFCFNNYEEGIQVRVRGTVVPVDNATEKGELVARRPIFQKWLDEGQEPVMYRLKNGLAHVWTIEKNFEPKEFIRL